MPLAFGKSFIPGAPISSHLIRAMTRSHLTPRLAAFNLTFQAGFRMGEIVLIA
jgi:hypothetical protein